MERAALAELCGDRHAQEAHLRAAHEAFTRMGASGRARETAAALARLVA